MGEAKLNPDAKKHYLKTWPEYFREVKRRAKRFEIRLNDRDFKKGDILILQEWDPKTQEYTGQSVTAAVTYTLQNEQFLQSGYIAMSLNIIKIIFRAAAWIDTHGERGPGT